MPRRNRGMTLIELIVAGTILLTVGAGVFTLLARAWQNHETLIAQNMVQREARAALDMATDSVRNMAPWIVGAQSPVMLYTDPASSILGFRSLSNGFSIRRYLELVNPGQPRRYRLKRVNVDGQVIAIVDNITQFQIVAVMRQRSADGTVSWTQAGDIRNLPASGLYDSRMGTVCMLHITVTATDSTGTYRSTVSTAVKVRNQFYTIAPPAG